MEKEYAHKLSSNEVLLQQTVKKNIYTSFTARNYKEEQQIVTFKKLVLADVK